MCPRLACFRLQDSGENELRKSLRARVLFTLLARFFRSSTLTESLAKARPWSVPKTNSARDSALYFQMWCKTYKRLVYRLQPSRHTDVCKISRLCRAISLLTLDVSPLNYASLPFLRRSFQQCRWILAHWPLFHSTSGQLPRDTSHFESTRRKCRSDPSFNKFDILCAHVEASE